MESDLYKGKRILDVKYGDINGDKKLEKVVLTGEEFYPTSVDVKDLVIFIFESDNTVVTQPIPGAAGNDFELILEKVTTEDRDYIMIKGKPPLGDYLIVLIYLYMKRSIFEVFNGDKFALEYSCSAMYQDNYRVELICTQVNRRYFIDIKNKEKYYEGKIYTKDGKVIIGNRQPYLSFIKEIYLVKSRDVGYYKLLTYQDILDMDFGDIICTVERMFSLDGMGEIKGITQKVTQEGEFIKTPFDKEKKNFMV
jgi:hypothetical protein